jgi:hypothetical protein
LKSEVKKKMTLNEHATHTPKSLCRAQVENFLAGIGLISSAKKKPGAKLEENLCSRLVAVAVRLQKPKLSGKARHRNGIHPFRLRYIYN